MSDQGRRRSPIRMEIPLVLRSRAGDKEAGEAGRNNSERDYAELGKEEMESEEDEEDGEDDSVKEDEPVVSADSGAEMGEEEESEDKEEAENAEETASKKEKDLGEDEDEVEKRIGNMLQIPKGNQMFDDLPHPSPVVKFDTRQKPELVGVQWRPKTRAETIANSGKTNDYRAELSKPQIGSEWKKGGRLRGTKWLVGIGFKQGEHQERLNLFLSHSGVDVNDIGLNKDTVAKTVGKVLSWPTGAWSKGQQKGV
ncbi:hypothetical protein U1Q18_025696 [Sarracenia purpurea var. burkii]